MLRIGVWTQGVASGTYRFDKSIVTVGRSPECDVCLQDPLISSQHLVMRFKDQTWLIEDTSKNGVNLQNGDWAPQRMKIEGSITLKLGRLFQIEISTTQTLQHPKVEKTILSTQAATQLMKVSDDQILWGRARLILLDHKGQQRVVTMESSSLSLGTHPSNDIVLDSSRVSQFHARIDLSQNRFVLSDLQSTNGTFLDGLRVSRAHLEANSEIKLGDIPIQFELESRHSPLKASSQTEFMGMISNHPKMRQLFSLAEAAASCDAPIFIHGETGTGKELLARALHQLSPRHQGPFVALNCAALPKELIESELFGHERGAFTGATQSREGAFEIANGGTLFLDEMGELDLSLQAKLLRALESGEIRHVGSNRVTHVSVRIISATHKDLKREVENGRFREDLYFRLHVVPMQIPPLRERIEDLPALTAHLLKALKSDLKISDDALVALARYDFPGNVRELKNILQRAIVDYEINLTGRGPKGELGLSHFRFLDELKHFRPARTHQEVGERQQMLAILRDCHFNQSEAARRLGLPISTFHDRMKRYGLEKHRQPIPTSLAS